MDGEIVAQKDKVICIASQGLRLNSKTENRVLPPNIGNTSIHIIYVCTQMGENKITPTIHRKSVLSLIQYNNGKLYIYAYARFEIMLYFL